MKNNVPTIFDGLDNLLQLVTNLMPTKADSLRKGRRHRPMLQSLQLKVLYPVQ